MIINVCNHCVFFSVKCEDKKCQSNALCKENKCVCANGYIENKGICEGMKKRSNVNNR